MCCNCLSYQRFLTAGQTRNALREQPPAITVLHECIPENSFDVKKSKVFRLFIQAFIACALLVSSTLKGQTLSGKVVDNRNGGIKDASVRLLLSNVECASDANGRFSFNGNAVLPEPEKMSSLSDNDNIHHSTDMYTLNGRKTTVYLPFIGKKTLSLNRYVNHTAPAAQLFVRFDTLDIAENLSLFRTSQSTKVDTLLITHEKYLFRKLVVDDVNGDAGTVILKDADDFIADYWEYLSGYYLEQDKLPFDPFGFPSIDSLYRFPGDPFTIYLTKKQGRELMDALDQNTVGLGIRIDSVAAGYRIIEVFSGAPAYDAGLMEADIITMIDSTEIVGLPVDECVKLLRGDVGESVRLVIQREEHTREILVTREKYQLPSVHVDSIDQSTILVTVTGFTRNSDYLIGGGTADEFGGVVRGHLWADNIIIDLRSNGGGYLSEGIGCVSWFMEPGVELLHVRGRELNALTGEYFTTDTSYYSMGKMSTFDKNVAILADSLTASTSEAFIAMMKGVFPDVPVIGTTTYGKGIGQIILMGPDSGFARITCLELASLSGEVWNGIGITPDYEAGEGDDPIEMALALFNGAMIKRRQGTFSVPVTERRFSIDFCVVDIHGW